MAKARVTIVEAERLNETELIVTFSDGSTATYYADALLSLAPNRVPSGKEPGR